MYIVEDSIHGFDLMESSEVEHVSINIIDDNNDNNEELLVVEWIHVS